MSGKFQPGQSGNLRGRPRDKTASTMLRKAIANDMPEIVNTLVLLAKGGDIQAAKVLLDRVCPALRPQAMAIDLPVTGSLAEQGNEIITATLNGRIPPDIGAQLITALSNQGKLIELQEMTDRLQRIERLLETRQ